jgi:predicted hotdog family 3-hydroxylacyl-ACP dehydratase
MMPDRAAIERLVPHTGAMCLLDAVTGWNAEHITCTAPEPTAANPLWRDGALPAVTACEYAAQAAAVHGALLDAQAAPRPGMLAKVMDVRLSRASFPAGMPLLVRAELLSRAAAGCLYAFDVSSDGQPVVQGRLMVAFSPESA